MTDKFPAGAPFENLHRFNKISRFPFLYITAFFASLVNNAIDSVHNILNKFCHLFEFQNRTVMRILQNLYAEQI